MSSPNFQNISSRGSFKTNVKSHSLLNDAYFIWFYSQTTKFCGYVECSLLWNDEEVAICIVESCISHRTIGGINQNGATVTSLGITCSADDSEAVDKVDGPLGITGNVKWLPSKLIRICFLLLEGITEKGILQTL